jgi:hypothetical protein
VLRSDCHRRCWRICARIARISITEIGRWRREPGRLNNSSNRLSSKHNMDISAWVVCELLVVISKRYSEYGLAGLGLIDARLWDEVLFSGKIGRWFREPGKGQDN